MRPRGELNGTSQPIFFLSPREKRANIPPFVVQTHLPFLFQSFPPFSPFHMFNFTVSLLHFASPLLTTRHKAYLPSLLPQSASYIILPLFFPLLFFHWRSTELLHFPFFRHSPPHFSSSLNPGDWSPLLLISPPSPPPPLCSPCPLRSLCGPSFSGSVWCVSLWSFCATVHPVDRKHPVHHHSQLPVGSAGSVWPICVIFCQITGVWLRVIRPSPNRLPGERGREAGERKVQAGQASSASSARPEGAPRRSSRLSRDTIHCSCMTKDAGALCLLKDV